MEITQLSIQIAETQTSNKEDFDVAYNAAKEILEDLLNLQAFANEFGYQVGVKGNIWLRHPRFDEAYENLKEGRITSLVQRMLTEKAVDGARVSLAKTYSQRGFKPIAVGQVTAGMDFRTGSKQAPIKVRHWILKRLKEMGLEDSEYYTIREDGSGQGHNSWPSRRYEEYPAGTFMIRITK